MQLIRHYEIYLKKYKGIYFLVLTFFENKIFISCSLLKITIRTENKFCFIHKNKESKYLQDMQPTGQPRLPLSLCSNCVTVMVDSQFFTVFCDLLSTNCFVFMDLKKLLLYYTCFGIITHVLVYFKTIKIYLKFYFVQIK